MMLHHPTRTLRRSCVALAITLLSPAGLSPAGLSPVGSSIAPFGGVPVALASTGASGSTAAATASSGAIVAQRGDRTPVVRAIQQALVSAGITVPGGVDGIFGPGTQSAVTEYQRRRGLTASGVVDTATAVALGVLPATPVLARGANGAAVTALQQQLIAVGITPRGGADGWFGSGTEAAVRQFQTSNGLPGTGAVDAATAAILTNASAGTTGTPSPTTPTTTPTTTSAPTAPALLRQGATGAEVAALQRALIAVGLRPSGGADGQFGPATAAALKAFQLRAGLPATGVYDQATATALIAASAAGPGSPPATGGGPSGTNADGSVTLAVFPMPQRCTFWDTWGAPRSGGRTHQGVDIIAPTGTPLYAVQAGTITRVQTNYPGSLAGHAVWLTAPDGTYFFYAHLNGFQPGVGKGTVVKAGDTIGYVGSTGNASIAHLHLEVHPRGGAAVNPYPIVRAVSGC